MVGLIVWYTYVLFSLKSRRFYTGFTGDLKNRLAEHNSKQGGLYSSKNAPFALIYFEACFSKKDSTKAEMFLKSGYGREVLRDKVKYSLEEINKRYPVV